MFYCKLIKTEQVKKISGLLCGIILAVFLLSLAFVIKEADHSCPGCGCPVCARVERCEKYLNQPVDIDNASGETVSATPVAAAPALLYNCSFTRPTLVSEKVKLSN